MNAIRIKVYLRIHREICEKYDGVEHLINDKIEKICSHEKLSQEENYF